MTRGLDRAGRALAAVAAAILVRAAGAADVDISLVRMGFGNHVRPGDPTALLVRATSSLQAPVQARIEWSVRNADGDQALYSRDAALAPGAPVERWLYGVMPIVSASAQSAVDLVTVVRVLEVEDGRVRRVLGEKRVDGASGEEPTVGVETTEGLVGVLGDGRAGLAAFATPTPSLGIIASMNELTRVARGIAAGDLPDRWEGLASYEALIWTNAPVQGFSGEQARAVLDWVRRGGNLVIVLPDSGDPWGIGGQRGRTPFGDVLPERARRTDGVEVARLLPVLSRGGELRNPSARTAVWTFDMDPGNAYVPLLLAPTAVDARTGNLVESEGIAGRPVVVRRPLGFGFVTVVGIDVDGLDRRALAAEGLPQADVFWNRIIGRRADAPGPAEWAALAEAKRLETRGGLAVPGDGGELVNRFIGLRSQAAIGILGLLGAFALYWAAAGPVSWWMLRRAGRVQYAWLAFVGVAAAAAVLAAASTGFFELKSGRVQHLTFIDRVERTGAAGDERALLRANSWFSAELPGYGTARVALGRGEGAAGSDLLVSWFPPPAGNSSGFPDSETYEVPASGQAGYDMPSRATSTVLHAAWMGVAPPRWDGTPRQMDGRRLRADVRWGARPSIVLHGALVHSLPGPLEEVTLVHITPFHAPARRTTGGTPPIIQPSDLLPNHARMVRRARWDPDEPLDVGTALYAPPSGSGPPEPRPAREDGEDGAARSIRARWYDKVLQSTAAQYDPASALSAEDRIEMLQLYSMLQPPGYLLDPQRTSAGWRGDAVRVERDFARSVDLSRWFSEHCLLVVGRLRDQDAAGEGTPFPFTIDGDEPKAEGTTWVRVAFPLPAVPGAMVPPPAPTAEPAP